MAFERRVYQELKPLTHDEAVAKLSTRDPVLVADALVAIGLFEENYELASKLILPEAQADDPVIRGAALIAIAHLARVHGQVPEVAIEIVRKP